MSEVFSIPDYQKKNLSSAVRKSLKGFRGYPDVAYNAGVVGGVIVHLGFFPDASNGYYIFGGTSAGAPQMSAITSLGNQLSHEPAGFLNDNLYKLGGIRLLRFVTHDVTLGNNDFLGVTGYSAAPGWDLTTGWGTPSKGFVLALGSN